MTLPGGALDVAAGGAFSPVVKSGKGTPDRMITYHAPGHTRIHRDAMRPVCITQLHQPVRREAGLTERPETRRAAARRSSSLAGWRRWLVGWSRVLPLLLRPIPGGELGDPLLIGRWCYYGMLCVCGSPVFPTPLARSVAPSLGHSSFEQVILAHGGASASC